MLKKGDSPSQKDLRVIVEKAREFKKSELYHLTFF